MNNDMLILHRATLRLASLLARRRPELLGHLAPVLQAVCPFRHSACFSTVVWFGRTYSFTRLQASIVSQLWAAWENGTPDCHQAPLLEQADSVATHLRHLFKGSPAFGTMIVPGSGKGTFRLADPDMPSVPMEAIPTVADTLDALASAPTDESDDDATVPHRPASDHPWRQRFKTL